MCANNDRELTPEMVAAADKFDADILIYFTQVTRESYWDLVEYLRQPRIRPNLLMVLSTYGGDPHAGYQTMRALQSVYKKTTIYVPGPCKSAGTLMAMGAHALVMDIPAELGPLDIQVLKKDEIAEMGSGLDINEALNALAGQALETFRKMLISIKLGAGVSTKMAADLAAKMTIGLYAPVFGQVDPIRLGEMQRAIAITYDYAVRLRTENVLEDAPSKLVTAYRDHGFVIDRTEACNLFVNVQHETEVERALLQAVGYSPDSPEAPSRLEIIRCPLGAEDDETARTNRARRAQKATAPDASTANREVNGPSP